MTTKYTLNNNILNTPTKKQRYRRRVPLIEPVKYGPIKIIENSKITFRWAIKNL